MTRRFTISAVLAVTLLTTWVWTGWSQDNESSQADVAPFMQMKLAYTKEIVEGLALADFDSIVHNAQKLNLMSLESTWNSVQTREYSTLSGEFRASVNRLRDAAKSRNLDGTTLAYFEVTLNCVRCHRYLRHQPADIIAEP